MKKKICIIGSTGSIGRQTLDVVDLFPGVFEVVGLAAGSNIDLLVEQAAKYQPKVICVGNIDLFKELKSRVNRIGDFRVTCGLEGLVETATLEGVDTVVTSISGSLGLIPTLEAIKAGKNIALANKETLVAAGEIVMSAAREHGVSILPVDSEHSAIFQCLNGEDINGVDKLILTASGGPFRDWDKNRLREVTLEMALRHPNWAMGPKITIDSATLMNKGLEVIEAKWLFGVEIDSIEVMIHPQSIIHSMVQFKDSSVIAQLGLPDMKVPIQYALTFPERMPNQLPTLDLAAVTTLTFYPPDPVTFECLNLAFEAGRQGGTLAAVMNAANEEAVALFLKGEISFLHIPEIISEVMVKHSNILSPTLEEILEVDAWGREAARIMASNHKSYEDGV